jgi:hypothetical protein
VGATAIANVADAVSAGLSLSFTVAVNVEVPVVIGVPEITPVDGVRFSPAGSLPDVIDQL